MQKELSPQQIEDIKAAYLKDKLSLENQVIKLIVAGYDEYKAEYLVNKVIKDYKEELLKQSEEEKENENEKHIADAVVIICAISGALLGIKNPAWDLFAVIFAGLAGYLGYNAKPLAGMIRSVILAGLFPITFEFFFAKRSSFMYIELLLPLGICLIVAYLFQLVTSKIFYPEYD